MYFFTADIFAVYSGISQSYGSVYIFSENVMLAHLLVAIIVTNPLQINLIAVVIDCSKLNRSKEKTCSENLHT